MAETLVAERRTHRSPWRLQIVMTEQYAPKHAQSNLANGVSQGNGDSGTRISPA
jgi:hypothetical protein